MRYYIWITLLAVIAIIQAVPLNFGDGSVETESSSEIDYIESSSSIARGYEATSIESNNETTPRRSADIPEDNTSEAKSAEQKVNRPTLAVRSANDHTSEENSTEESGQKGGDERQRREANAEAAENADYDYAQGYEVMGSDPIGANEALYDDGIDKRIKRSAEDSSASNSTSEEDKKKAEDNATADSTATIRTSIAGEVETTPAGNEVTTTTAQPSI